MQGPANKKKFPESVYFNLEMEGSIERQN